VANLLTNAAKYTEPGGRVRLAAAEHGGRIEIRVEDTGTGIAPDLLPRVFDMFVQGQRSAARSEGGLGLGLALVRSLVGLHGGEVSAHSPGPGQGSTFIVRLPGMRGAAPTRPPSQEFLLPTTPRRVLIVDDNEDAAETLAEMIAEADHKVEVAHDGPAALAIVQRFHPEIAILDIGLPVMDGYELAARLRERFGPGLRLIAVTGYGQDHDRARSRHAGFEHHLVKPVKLRDLARCLADPAPAK